MSDLRNQILRAFVSYDKNRFKLHEVRSFGGYTFASDGHSAVCVPRIAEDADDHTIAPRLAAWIDYAMADRVRPMPSVKFPEPEIEECPACEGRGTEHDCPDCNCECSSCDGTGEWEQRLLVRYNGTLINGKQWKRIASLPNARIADQPNDKEHILFTFDGGVGLLMRMRGCEPDDVVVDVALEMEAA